jgi:hypothetical protein
LVCFFNKKLKTTVTSQGEKYWKYIYLWSWVMRKCVCQLLLKFHNFSDNGRYDEFICGTKRFYKLKQYQNNSRKMSQNMAPADPTIFLKDLVYSLEQSFHTTLYITSLQMFWGLIRYCWLFHLQRLCRENEVQMTCTYTLLLNQPQYNQWAKRVTAK